MSITPAIDFNALTASEILVIQAIVAGTYFVDNETPVGVVNGSNTTFTLANAPNPTDSLKLYSSGVRLEGSGEDFTLKTAGQIIFKSESVPITNERLLADYINSPV